MLDSHCHLADQAFSEDLPAVVRRAREAGVDTALCILAAGEAGEVVRAELLRNLWPEARSPKSSCVRSSSAAGGCLAGTRSRSRGIRPKHC